MRNVEFKAELRDIVVARGVLHSLRAVHARTFHQVDTYYRIPKGKLKKRETAGEETEYIFYERPTQATPKVSSFTIFSPEHARERFGKDPLPVWVTVRKERELWLVAHTRVHLDTVENLGTFLEVESLVSRSNTLARAQASATELLKLLRPVLGELIDAGYADMLARDQEDGPGPPLLPPGRKR